MFNKDIVLKVAGVELMLLSDKAIYWPDKRILILADVHIGKAASYRALGQPVPHGTTLSNLARIDHLLDKYTVNEIIFLGDFFHSEKSRNQKTLQALLKWRLENNTLKCTLIRGNHDLHAGDPPEELNFEVINEPLYLKPFALRHIPKSEGNCLVIAGHVHPVYRIKGKGRQSLRLACFYMADGMLLMPSFGEFTGGHEIKPNQHDKIFITTGQEIWQL